MGERSKYHVGRTGLPGDALKGNTPTSHAGQGPGVAIRVTFACVTPPHGPPATGNYYACADYISSIRLSFIIPDRSNLTRFQPPNYLSP